jgi:DNA-binding IclR family transcriptional regulator
MVIQTLARQPRDTPRIQSAARAIDLLLAIAASDEGLTASELSVRVGLRRPTTYHLLQTLETTGLVNRSGNRAYRLGLRVATLVEGFTRQVSPPERLLPFVRRLADETGETAYVATRTGDEIVLLASVRGRHAVSVADIPIGVITDAHARASGKLVLAHMTSAERAAYLNTHPLDRRTPNTIVDRAALERELEDIRGRGYSFDREEYVLGVCCLAARLDNGTSPFIVSISAPSRRFEDNRDRYRDITLAVAGSAAPGASR